MTTTIRKLAELFRAIAAEDIRSASVLAAEVCSIEEKQGHRTVAKQLRGALKANKSERSAVLDTPTTASESSSFFSSALVRLEGGRDLDDIVLSADVRSELEHVVLEWKRSAKLRELGIAPRSKLLFHGPPGCGKSLTAQALGRELGLPVYMVRFDAVIGAFLGQTAIHLRQLFHFAETTACVLLLDELDALGKRRGSPLDVGELDRIVISLLQELEHARPIGVVVATTNLAKHLDDALWRRFDLEILFKRPSETQLATFVEQIANQKRTKLAPNVARRAARTTSFAEAEKAVISEIRRQALQQDEG